MSNGYHLSFFFISFIRNSFYFQLIVGLMRHFCTKCFQPCNIIVTLRPLTIKKDLDEKIFVD
jgi:hypothetical protein